MRQGLRLVASNGSLAVAVPVGRTLVVGRSPACDVSIRDLTVSRHHGEIEAETAGLRIRDLGSTNGTFINGSRISDGVAAPGSRVSFGKVAFQVQEEPAKGVTAGDQEAASRIRVVGQMRAQSATDVSSLLALDAGNLGSAPAAGGAGSAAGAGVASGTGASGAAGGRGESGTGATRGEGGAGGSQLRVRGDTPAERRVTALALLLEVAKELSQQGEPARLFDKAARLALQALAVDRVEVLTLGEGDEMVSRVSKMRPGLPVRDSQVPRAAAHKAVLERAAVLIEEQVAPAEADPSLAPPTPAHPAHPASTEEAPSGAHHPLPSATTDAVQVAVDFDRAAELGSGGISVHPASAAAAESARGNAICAPLLGMQATVLGLLYLETAEARALGREELQFVTALAGILAVSLENLWLMERARGEAVARAGLQRHFGPAVAEQVAGPGQDGGGAGLAPALRRVAFLSCEIRGVTALAETLPVEETARLLNELIGELVELVFEHGGTLGTLSGTSLDALWGAPLSRRDDAEEAVQSAIAMQRALERLNGDWGRQGRSQLAIAIGIDLGEVFAGNLGSERRMEFAAIGKPVAGAERLRAAAAAGELVVSEAVLAALANPPPVDAVPLPAAAGLPAEAPAGDGTAGEQSGSAYRIDWRTPPTLRQSGELSQA